MPVSLEASETNPLGLNPMQGLKLRKYSSWFITSLPPSTPLTQSGSSVCATFTSSSMAAKASSKYIDLSSDLSMPTPEPCRVGKAPAKSGGGGGAIGTVEGTTLSPPNPLLPTPSSKLELILGKDETGRPRKFPARAHTRSSSSLSRTFSIRRCCSSSEISPIIAGPPQLVQSGFLIASLIDMFSARSLSFSCLSIEFSCRSSCVCSNQTKPKL
nr:hypothetical protein TorRG33x02_218610 [Ipomoea batatas]